MNFCQAIFSKNCARYRKKRMRVPNCNFSLVLMAYTSIVLSRLGEWYASTITIDIIFIKKFLIGQKNSAYPYAPPPRPGNETVIPEALWVSGLGSNATEKEKPFFPGPHQDKMLRCQIKSGQFVIGVVYSPIIHIDSTLRDKPPCLPF